MPLGATNVVTLITGDIAVIGGPFEYRLNCDFSDAQASLVPTQATPHGPLVLQK